MVREKSNPGGNGIGCPAQKPIYKSDTGQFVTGRIAGIELNEFDKLTQLRYNPNVQEDIDHLEVT